MREKREGGEGTALDKIQKELLNSSFGSRALSKHVTQLQPSRSGASLSN